MDGYRYAIVDAATQGDLRRIISFLSEGLDVVNARDEFNQTALHRAAANGHAHILRVLLDEQSGNVDQTDIWQFTPLHLAAQNGHFNAMRLLLSKGANPNLKNSDGLTPAELADQHKHFELAHFVRGSHIKPKKVGVSTALYKS